MFRGFKLGAGSLLEAEADEDGPGVSPTTTPLALPMELRIREC
jgi:hypothetical protein